MSSLDDLAIEELELCDAACVFLLDYVVMEQAGEMEL